MRKIYDAVGEEKESIIICDNAYRAFDRNRCAYKEIGIDDFVLIGNIDIKKLSKKLAIKWSLNGLLPENLETEDITIIEPLSEHIEEKIVKLNEIDTRFDKEVELSKKAILLMPVNLYEGLKKESKYSDILKKFNIRLYEGKKELALRMLLFDKRYIYLELDENGYDLDAQDSLDGRDYKLALIEKQKEILKGIRKKKEKLQKEFKHEEENESENSRMITGLTKNVEGNIELDEEMQATTDIGKVRENQEDAILLIKDKKIPNFKMMVVADGVGGSKYGEVASHLIIQELKKWFENLSNEQKQYYYTGMEGFKEDLLDEIELKLQPIVECDIGGLGASTLVCAIVGKNDTIVANVGDSRAYIVKNGNLIQVSREDTVAQENLESGKTPTKEAARFDEEACAILQCIGMDRRDLIRPHIKIIDNKDYDMLLLFTDGVTDCLSDEDIAVACRTTDKKVLANKIVEQAIKHDSIREEKYEEYNHLNLYIPGGKDNTSAAVYMPKRDEER